LLSFRNFGMGSTTKNEALKRLLTMITTVDDIGPSFRTSYVFVVDRFQGALRAITLMLNVKC
jgi:hypothetical protein